MKKMNKEIRLFQVERDNLLQPTGGHKENSRILQNAGNKVGTGNPRTFYWLLQVRQEIKKNNYRDFMQEISFNKNKAGLIYS